jgi:hypothetical protein
VEIGRKTDPKICSNVKKFFHTTSTALFTALLARLAHCRYAVAMYDDFHVSDHWTGDDLHCRWKAVMVAIATRHADAVDVRFDVNGTPVWIAMPCEAWVEYRKRTTVAITDALATQIAGRFLKQSIENGFENGREMYTMSVDEVLGQLDEVLKEAGNTAALPQLPRTGDAEAMTYWGKLSPGS